VDLLYYWFHRLSHEVNFLWAAHIVHHQSEEYNLSVALAPKLVAGPVQLLVLHADSGSGCSSDHPSSRWARSSHSTNSGSTRRPLVAWDLWNGMFNTPSHHRVHHGSDPKYIDRNHAGTLIIWDKLFGTYQAEEEEPIYGITTPLRTWDPVQANFHYYRDLWRLAKRCSKWQDKVRVFLKPPGWRPPELGGFEAPTAKDRSTYRKFDTNVSISVNAHVAAQFVLLLAVATFFLFEQSELGKGRMWATSALIVLWVMGLGTMLGGRRIGIVLETARILGLAALAFTSADRLPLELVVTVVIVVCTTSTVTLALAYRSMASPTVQR
jgi:alkylglycerol monooxygenase